MATKTPQIRTGEYADVMPDMGDEEYQALKASIREHGFDETTPIVVDADGVIVDGHHRFRACQELGVEPTFITVEDPTIEQAYRSNLARRNVAGGTKREIVKRYLDQHFDGDRTQKEVADELGVAESTVSEARKEFDDRIVSTEEKRQQARAYIEANPDASDREVAREVEADISHPTVGAVRDELEAAAGDDAEAEAFDSVDELVGDGQPDPDPVEDEDASDAVGEEEETDAPAEEPPTVGEPDPRPDEPPESESADGAVGGPVEADRLDEKSADGPTVEELQAIVGEQNQRIDDLVARVHTAEECREAAQDALVYVDRTISNLDAGDPLGAMDAAENARAVLQQATQGSA